MQTIQIPQKRFRMIIPAFPPEGIFSGFNKRITSLGAVLIATIVDKYLPNWTAEIIDENNYHKGPLDAHQPVDHRTLQAETPADAVGFYCGLSSSVPRVWQLARFYKEQGVLTIAGGWHVHYMPEESLNKGLDVVVKGDGEQAILDVLTAFGQDQPPRGIIHREQTDLNALPIPDFGLLRYAKVRIYPIGRIRGCSKQCEFCSVKGQPRCSSPDYVFRVVKWLVETRRAKSFFITDDRMEEDREGYLELFRMIAQQFTNRLRFTVQVRLAAIQDKELIDAMRQAGVRHVCIGIESPIEEELKGMHKGMRVDHMIQYARAWRKYFFVHGMFIFGYPLTNPSDISYRERINRFKRFIRKSKIDTIQVLRPVPLIGTKLRERLQENGQLFPLELVGWDKYDGNYVCFKPNNMSVEELQKGPTKIMTGFYNRFARFLLPIRTVTLPFYYPITGWHYWYRGWWNEVIKVWGYRLLKKWKNDEQAFLEKIQDPSAMKQV
ncbi:radical SAM protein [bacterium]|nr:radical SAM protein [bacterium]